MSRIVFILGAGASVAGGAPTMDRFISSAGELLRSGGLKSADDRQAFDAVLLARSKLQAVHSKAVLDLNNIEALFGAFEMAALLGKLSDLEQSEVDALPQAIVRVIARTIEARLLFPVQGSVERRYVGVPKPYEEFLKLIHDIRERELAFPGAGSSVSVITFNYDLAFDYAADFLGVPIDYCLENAQTSSVRFLKLHGSLNWARCNGCNRVVAWYLNQFLRARMWPLWDGMPNVLLDVSARLGEFNHCTGSVQGVPTIVPPTWNKGKHHSELVNVWRAAASALSEAEHVFIIGYSLPRTDEFFRHFYALGSEGGQILNTLWVVNPDSTVEQNFKEVLGPAALAPGCYAFRREKFEDCIGHIRNRLGIEQVKTAYR